MCIYGILKIKEQNRHEWQHARHCWSHKKQHEIEQPRWVAKPLAEANVCRLKQLTWNTSPANRMQKSISWVINWCRLAIMWADAGWTRVCGLPELEHCLIFLTKFLPRFISSWLPSLQHACFFVPVFSLYTFTPSCPLLVGTVTLRYIYVCTRYLKLCSIILLLLFILNSYYKYLTTGWWKHLNGTLYQILQWNFHGDIVKFPLFPLVNVPDPRVTGVLFFISSNCFQ